MRLLKIEYKREDERGSLTQVNTADWKQFNYLKIAKGQEFGNHYHKHKTELFYVVKGELLFEIAKEENRMEFILHTGEGIIIEPYDNHTLFALENSEIVELLSPPYSKEDVYND